MRCRLPHCLLSLPTQMGARTARRVEPIIRKVDVLLMSTPLRDKPSLVLHSPEAQGLRADRDVRVGSVPRQLGLRRLGCRETYPTCTTRSEGNACAPCERTTSSEGVPGRVYPVKVKVSPLVVAGSACGAQVVQPLPAHLRRRRRARSTRRTDYVQAYPFSCEVGVRSTVGFVPHVFATGSGLCQSFSWFSDGCSSVLFVAYCCGLRTHPFGLAGLEYYPP